MEYNHRGSPGNKATHVQNCHDKYTFSNYHQLTLSSLAHQICYVTRSDHISPTHTFILCVHFPCAQDGFFPLYVASKKGYIGIVDVLIKAGARVDLQTKVGFAVALNVRSPSAPHYHTEHTDALLGGYGGHRPIHTVCALY